MLVGKSIGSFIIERYWCISRFFFFDMASMVFVITMIDSNFAKFDGYFLSLFDTLN